MDEHELIAQVKRGDESAYAVLVHLYKDRIVNFLFQMTNDYQRAVDLSQETFLRVYFKADRYRPIAPLSSWIFAIAANLAKTDIKRRKRMAMVSIEDLPPSVALSSPGEFANSGLSGNLRRALDDLHPRYRIPILLKDVEGYSQEEIAQIIKRPVGTVKARISRGRAILRKSLENARRDLNAAPKTEMLDERL